MALDKNRHTLEQIGILTGTLGATVVSAIFVPALAPFCFAVGAAGIVWHEMRRGHHYIAQNARKINALETTTQRIQRETSILREDLESLSMGFAPSSRREQTSVSSPKTEVIKSEIEKFEKPVKQTATDTSSAPVRPARIKDGGSLVLSDTVVRELLMHAIEHDRIELFAQSILKLPQRKTAYYELFARLRAGSGFHVPADRYMALAEKEDVIPALDTVMLLHTLRILREQQDSEDMATHQGFFLNVSPHTLSDIKFVSDLLAFVERHPALARRLVFEFSALHMPALDRRTQKVLTGLSKLGCRFSIDHVSVENYTPSLLSLAPLSFLKMDTQSVMRGISKSARHARLRQIRQELGAARVTLLFDRIEKEEQVLEILDCDADYGQGNLFAPAQPLVNLLNPLPTRKTA